jgi:hypothetical protein
MPTVIHPPSVNFSDQRHEQDADRHHQADERERKPVWPAPVALAHSPPIDAQSQEGERERQEHVDAVEYDQQRHAAAGHEQNAEGGETHQQDAALRHQPR